MRILCIAGARPNFMKVKPVVDALESRGVETILVHTGQHYDPAMSDVFFSDLGLRHPDVHLGVGSGTQAEQTAGVMTAFEPVLDKLDPDVVVVVGDVNSTLGCALVTAKHPAKLAHVEAGLRSGDWTMPEEVNRVVTDRVSDILFAPSADGVDNLLAEGSSRRRIYLVGNVMVDSLVSNLERARKRDILARLDLERRQFALVTVHRSATVDDRNLLTRLVQVLDELGEHLPVVFPAHPRTMANLRRLSPRNVNIMEPVGYLDFLALEDAARIVLTDSGGVQEETTVLGIPCLTLRDSTERPITVAQGSNRLIGRKPENVLTEALDAMEQEMSPRRPPLWDGHTGERIASILSGKGVT